MRNWRRLLAKPGPVVCPICLAEHRAQRAEYDLAANFWVCFVHGPVLTQELVDHLVGLDVGVLS